MKNMARGSLGKPHMQDPTSDYTTPFLLSCILINTCSSQLLKVFAIQMLLFHVRSQYCAWVRLVVFCVNANELKHFHCVIFQSVKCANASCWTDKAPRACFNCSRGRRLRSTRVCVKGITVIWVHSIGSCNLLLEESLIFYIPAASADLRPYHLISAGGLNSKYSSLPRLWLNIYVCVTRGVNRSVNRGVTSLHEQTSWTPVHAMQSNQECPQGGETSAKSQVKKGRF